jgi:chitin disaccharide deacetylase
MIQRCSTSPRLVVTADDFGLSPGVDQGILESFRRGIVSSTALLVNFPEMADSVARLRQEPELEVGIHFNLTAGLPVLPPERVPSLVGANGAFHDFRTFFVRVALSRIDWGEVTLEWQAQFERGLDLGCRFAFLTSHQHVHMVPEAAQICTKLAHKFGVGAVRLSNFWLSEMLSPLRLKALALAPFVGTVRKILKDGAVFCSGSILEIPPGNPHWALRQVCRMIKRLDGGVHELVCHPGYVDSLLEARDPYVAGRPTELAVLVGAELRAFLETAGIERTTFRELAGYVRRNDGAHTQSRSTEESWHPAIWPS